MQILEKIYIYPTRIYHLDHNIISFACMHSLHIQLLRNNYYKLSILAISHAFIRCLNIDMHTKNNHN